MAIKRWSFDEYGFDGTGCMYHPKPGCVHISDDSAKFVGSLTNLRKGLHAPALDIDYHATIEVLPEGTRLTIKGPRPERRHLNALLDTLVSSGIMDAAAAQSLRTDAAPEERSDLPALVLKVGAQLHPSSTAGHFHLYLDQEMTWETYKGLLEALYYADVIGRDFCNMCLRWRCSFLLKPGRTKNDIKVTFAAS